MVRPAFTIAAAAVVAAAAAAPIEPPLVGDADACTVPELPLLTSAHLFFGHFLLFLGGSHLRPNGPRHSWIPMHTSRWEAMCFRTDGLVDFNLRVALGRTG